MAIKGLEGLSAEEVNIELQLGGKFVVYQYCVSVLIMTFRQPSAIYFVKFGESRILKGLPSTLLSFLLGWWGFPWGPIYTIGSLITNFSGGKDVTDTVISALTASEASSVTTPNNSEPIGLGVSSVVKEDELTAIAYQRLAEGRRPDLVVDELVRSGWSRETVDDLVWSIHNQMKAGVSLENITPGGKH